MAQSVKCTLCEHKDLSTHIKSWAWWQAPTIPALGKGKDRRVPTGDNRLVLSNW